MRAKPSVKELVTELDQFHGWQLLMLNLGMEKYKNDKIEINFPQDVDRQKQEAFDQWLRLKPDACWKDVIDALFAIEENTLARKLTRKYNWKDPRVSIGWLVLNICAIIKFINNDNVKLQRNV